MDMRSDIQREDRINQAFLAFLLAVVSAGLFVVGALI